MDEQEYRELIIIGTAVEDAASLLHVDWRTTEDSYLVLFSRMFALDGWCWIQNEELPQKLAILDQDTWRRHITVYKVAEACWSGGFRKVHVEFNGLYTIWQGRVTKHVFDWRTYLDKLDR